MRQKLDPYKDGLYNKYEVRRLDGSDEGENRRYFVLDVDRDPYARIALQAYALNCADDYPELAKDLKELHMDAARKAAERGLT